MFNITNCLKIINSIIKNANSLIFMIHLSVNMSIHILAGEILISSEVSMVIDYGGFMETILRWILKNIYMSIILIYYL